MKTVTITGATGNMGWAGFQELYSRKDRFHIRLLARPSKKNKKKLELYLSDPSVSVIWGDLTRYKDVLEAVSGADYVLHVGGMVSPVADLYPDKTLRVNTLAAQNVVRAVLAQPNADTLKLVYIGSVAQLGDKLPPHHWGRSGDRVEASEFDAYSLSKCLAEKIIVDSGVRQWVSLRLSSLLYPGIFHQVNPVVFHVPLAGVLEWTTIEDAGRLLANVCEPWVSEDFWCDFYNISSGGEYRMTNYEFERLLLEPLGQKVEGVFRPEWFALKNFHGMWYTDSERLESFLHFRGGVSLREYMQRLNKELPWYYSLARLVPSALIRLFMKRYTLAPELGTQWMIANSPQKTRAFYGSIEKYQSIKTWADVLPPLLEKDLQMARAQGEVLEQNHGYDESRSIYALSSEELESFAISRGGHFLGPATLLGQKGAIFDWQCSEGHCFKASLEYVLKGGGWCESCY